VTPEVSSATVPVSPAPQWLTAPGDLGHRVDDTVTREYSPPAAPIVADDPGSARV